MITPSYGQEDGTIFKFGGYGYGNGKFNQPSGIAVTPSGNILVADTGNNRIQVLTYNGSFVSKWGAYGRDKDQLRLPNDIAVTPTGNILVADTGNNRIQVLSQNGTFVSKWGGYGRGDAQFRSPTDIAITDLAQIVITDKTNNRILRYSPNYTTGTQHNLTVTENANVNNTNLHVREIASDLEFPVALGFLGPKDVIVLERMSGLVKRVVDGKILEEPLLNISDYKFGSCMCGVDVVRNGDKTYVFIYMAELQAQNGKISERLYRYEFDNSTNSLVNSKVLLEIPVSSLSGMHHGGKVLLGPDGNIYAIIGDIDGRDTKAQNVVAGPEPDGSSSILRMTIDGKALNDNYSLGVTEPLNLYYGYGIRNSFGFDFDPITNGLWFTDNGASSHDEINFAEPGFNGGWNKAMGISSLSRTFDEGDLVTFEGKGKYTDPQFEWFETIGPTALVFLNSDKLGKEFENDLFVGDFELGNIYHFDLNRTRTGLSLNGTLADKIANNSQEASPLIFVRGLGGITDMKISPDGMIYVTSALGKIYAIMPNSQSDKASPLTTN